MQDPYIFKYDHRWGEHASCALRALFLCVDTFSSHVDKHDSSVWSQYYYLAFIPANIELNYAHKWFVGKRYNLYHT